MSRHRLNPATLERRRDMTEEEFQEKWKDDPSPFVQGVLKSRRERSRRGERFLNRDEINREVRRRRYGDDAA